MLPGSGLVIDGWKLTVRGVRPVSAQTTSLTTTEDGQTTTLTTPAGFRGLQRSRPSFFSQYKWYIVGLVILIVAFVIYFKYRKEKLLNPKYKFKDLFKKGKKK